MICASARAAHTVNSSATLLAVDQPQECWSDHLSNWPRPACHGGNALADPVGIYGKNGV